MKIIIVNTIDSNDLEDLYYLLTLCKLGDVKVIKRIGNLTAEIVNEAAIVRSER